MRFPLEWLFIAKLQLSQFLIKRSWKVILLLLNLQYNYFPSKPLQTETRWSSMTSFLFLLATDLPLSSIISPPISPPPPVEHLMDIYWVSSSSPIVRIQWLSKLEQWLILIWLEFKRSPQTLPKPMKWHCWRRFHFYLATNRINIESQIVGLNGALWPIWRRWPFSIEQIYWYGFSTSGLPLQNLFPRPFAPPTNHQQQLIFFVCCCFFRISSSTLSASPYCNLLSNVNTFYISKIINKRQQCAFLLLRVFSPGHHRPFILLAIGWRGLVDRH